MIHWIGSLFGLEPVKQPVEQQSKAVQTYHHPINHTQAQTVHFPPGQICNGHLISPII